MEKSNEMIGREMILVEEENCHCRTLLPGGGSTVDLQNLQAAPFPHADNPNRPLPCLVGATDQSLSKLISPGIK